ncbi:hypothetical protein C9374_008843 [Naegleria lovaniensis]|uniref:Fatty acid desaturase domain-containing protein n=1 Tax=Naegleria lovaniensis TaxID=51637 RepID=A0AA88KHF1_NAELO|nr:uncharacterized protein C9374_008843 [Naegleria lovaniensis]KAG2377758.1 hypothetical protein C9374_008843 [Naegleria lovaniensis]
MLSARSRLLLLVLPNTLANKQYNKSLLPELYSNLQRNQRIFFSHHHSVTNQQQQTLSNVNVHETTHYQSHPTYQPGVPRIHPTDPKCNALEGEVKYSPLKSLWYAGMSYTAIIGGILTFDPSLILQDLAVFIGTTGISILFGHSLGMHRKFIHNSYECPKWLEYLLVHFGTLMGIAGPIGMMKAHDLRDWAQRQPPQQCHPYYGQQESFWKDAYWQMHCTFQLKHPPQVVLGENISQDKVIQFMEKTWMLQQLPWALLFYALGGWHWIIWGICARVAVCVHGHFFVGWYAHNHGPIQSRSYHVQNACIQGYNVKGWPYLGTSEFAQKLQAVMTAGECYHNNHHAYPGSAKLALKDDELDIGFKVLKMMEKLGLVWNLKLPKDLPSRPELQKLDQE